ncbi:hypothetical protein [Methanoculleus chikugoensis]|uniref:ATP cone domain-containing protein n=1 Tax=Methanoculleus chikugoensis TaxID=118126 RepID=UPI0006CF4C91|nr:ATP cone domain-containing protein [Methanoculleus chikugoensis]
MKHVTKADGGRQPFDPEKVQRTLRKMGVGAEDAERIAGEIAESVPDGGVRTAAVLRMIRARAKAVHPRRQPPDEPPESARPSALETGLRGVRAGSPP